METINMRARGAWLLVATLTLFFFSGACGLVYQVAWTRQLVLLFGTTAHAVSTVLSVFFLGLGLGSYFGGRFADRCARPLRWYGLFEIAIAAWAVLYLASLRGGEEFVVALLRAAGASRGAGIALRALLACALILPPVLLMGATLPLLAKHIERNARTIGRRTGLLYAMNTLGAVCGCFAAGFVLIPGAGYTRTILVAAALNLCAGVLAVFFARRTPVDEVDTADQVEEVAKKRDHEQTVIPANAGIQAGAFEHQRAIAIAAFAITGFCGLAFEVVWTRLLTIVLLGTTYAYTTMLGTMLLGIALGGVFGAYLAGRTRAPMWLLGALLTLYGGMAILSLHQLAALPAQMGELAPLAGRDWPAYWRGVLGLCAQAIALPAFASGAVFPVAARIASRAWRTLGGDIGRLYMVNTLAGVLGAAAGGFVFIPALGAHKAILLLGVSLMLLGAGAIVFTPAQSAMRKAILLALAALFAGVALRAAPADVNAALNIGYVPIGHRILSVREGVEGTVVVSEPEAAKDGADRVLWINRVQATTSIERGVKMNRFEGVLPLVFDRDPRDVLFMCFGSGVTCGTLALSDFLHIDAVEISPDVIAAAPLFSKDNLGVVDRPNVQVHIDDGRNWLLTTPRRYDLITFEPMPLALAGVSAFYTREFYAACLARLNPGGMVSQWIPLHSSNLETVRALTATFTAVFPEYNAWFVNADLFLIGSNKPLRIDYARAAKRLAQPELRDALRACGYPDIESVLGSFLLDKQGLDAFAKGDAMRDDWPWAEFTMPRLVYTREVPPALAALAPLAASVLPYLNGGDPAQRAALERRQKSLRHDFDGLQHYYGGMSIGGEAAHAFIASLAIDPANANAQYYLREIANTQAPRFIAWGEWDKAAAIVNGALQYMPGDAGLQALAARIAAEAKSN